MLHPRSGQRCWFNQIAFLNEWTMDPEVREYLVDLYGEDGLPFNTRFGNGDPIGPEVIQVIDEVYEKNTACEPWQSGDRKSTRLNSSHLVISNAVFCLNKKKTSHTCVSSQSV